ncbi:MAG TPA: S1C family serine protease [Verrucomicrobiae bacterium]|nr:S1C family serine protease [Verrucomicrobiae bacterium]
MTYRASISRRRVAFGAAFLVLANTTAVLAAGLLETIDQEVSTIYENSKDTVVKVHAQRQFQIGALPFSPPQRVGTGFFTDRDGHILTAATIVDDADSCWIEWHGQKINARVVGRDPQTNLALLKIEPAAGSPTPFLPQGNSDELRVGSMVVAIGFPYDLPSAPVVGFINGIDIRCGSHVFATSHIRASCRLSPGQGGGPMLNVRGEVVGIAIAAHADDQCYGLPINAAHKICADLLEFGQPQYTWVGLGVSERQLAINPTVSNQWQVFIQQVYSNTPAAAAGFRDGDTLLSITSNEVHRSADVLNTMFCHRVGDTVEFTVLRGGQEQKLLLVVAARPPQESFSAQTTPQPGLLRAPGQWLTIVPSSQEH